MCDSHSDRPFGTPPAGWDDPVEPLPPVSGPTRRGILAGAGAAALGAGLVLGTSTPATATPTAGGGHHGGGHVNGGRWVVGDHHVHTVFSHDAKYLVRTQVEKAHEYGLDWMVFTEHSNFAHYEKGAHMEKAELARLRREYPRLMLFQGLEWYIPAAEHCTVMVAPGPNDADLLRQFEKLWDGKLNKWEKPEPGSPQVAEWEGKAVEALRWLDAQRRRCVVDDVLVMANHPLRLGIDSPQEIRAWRDAAPGTMIGMEGSPGAQASAFGTFRDPKYQRGEYENAPSPYSWPGYPVEAYRTRGGFDWATAVVGGLWDSMLAEGLPFWISANSDHHLEARDRTRVGDYPPGETFDTLGHRPPPAPTDPPQNGSDYWPGKFSRTHTLVARRSYRDVMAGLRAGRSWVDHGHLVAGVDVQVTGRSGGRGAGRGHTPRTPRARRRRRALGLVDGGRLVGRPVGTTLGGRISVARGSAVELSVTISPTTYRNAAGIIPRLAHVDVIRGAVRGRVTDRDTWQAPDTRVVAQTDVTGRRGSYTLRYRFTADESFYLRLRGSDGNRGGVGPLGASVDPRGPVPHGGGTDEGNPWIDTWFYTNPVFVDVH